MEKHANKCGLLKNEMRAHIDTIQHQIGGVNKFHNRSH